MSYKFFNNVFLHFSVSSETVGFNFRALSIPLGRIATLGAKAGDEKHVAGSTETRGDEKHVSDWRYDSWG